MCVSGASDCLLWAHTVIFRDHGVNIRLLRKAEESGYKAAVFTVDTPIVGRKVSDLRNRAHLRAHSKFPNLVPGDNENDTAENSRYENAKYIMKECFDWKDVDWLRSMTKLPIVVKGIMTPEDAVTAIEHGIQGIVVSNHGGRQLDTMPATVMLYLITSHVGH